MTNHEIVMVVAPVEEVDGPVAVKGLLCNDLALSEIEDACLPLQFY
jgi:hypothetical protein